MKKLLIASLIASTALSAVADETTLYGSIGYDVATGQTAKRLKDGGTKGRWNLDTDELNWGIKGEENINPNLTAFWNLKFGHNGSGMKKELAYVGLRGDSWGTLTLGTQDSLVKVVTDYNDIFDSVSFWGKGTKFDEQLDHPDRVISYVSPNWSGFQFGVAGILNGKDGKIVDTGLEGSGSAVAYSSVSYENNKGKIKTAGSKSFGAAQVGLWYDNYGFYAGLAYQYAGSKIIDRDTGYSVEPDEKLGYIPRSATLRGRVKARPQEVTAIAVGYKQDNFKVGLTEKHLSSDGDKVSLAGEYYYGPHTVRAGFGVANSNSLNSSLDKDAWRNSYGEWVFCPNNDFCRGSKNVYTYALGYKYNLSKRTYTYVEGLYADNNTKKYTYYDARGRKHTISNPRRNEYEVKFGLRHDF